MSATKACTKCKEVKPLTDFHRSSDALDGHASWCKRCVCSIKRESRQRTYSRENKRRWQIKTRYGMTMDQVDAMRVAQGGACGVCGTALEKFHIDHCHRTGAVRGLLCHRCNVRLGGLDDVEWRGKALAYLSKTE